MRKLDDINLDRIPPRTLQTICLVLAGVISFFSMIVGFLVDGPLKGYVVFYSSILGALFAGITIRQTMSRTTKLLFFTGAAVCCWIILLQLSDYRHFSDTAYYGARFIYSAFLCEYLMLLPCGSVLDEGERPRGLYWICGIFAAVGAVFGILTILLYLQIIPVIFSRYMGWIGSRLTINWHPNVLARIIMAAMGCTVALTCVCRKAWGRILLCLLAAGEFVCLALTNSRTAILLTCCLMGGVAFFLIYRGDRRTVKHFLLGAVAALAVIVLLYKTSDLIINKQYAYISDNDLPTEVNMNVEIDGKEVPLTKEPRRLTEGLAGFNGRGAIWSAAFRAIAAKPSVLLTGTEDSGAFISEFYDSGYFQVGVAHAHNAWLETLLRTGLVGFLAALWITWLAVRSCLQILFFRKTTLFQKVIGMVVICALGSEFFEPNLFYTEVPDNFLNVIMLLSTGYLVYWADRAEKLPLGKAASRPQ